MKNRTKYLLLKRVQFDSKRTVKSLFQGMRQHILLLIIFGISLSSCKGGKQVDPPPAIPINVNSFTITDYNDTQVFISLVGDVVAAGTNDLDQVQFFDNGACAGTPIGQEVAVNVPNGVALTLKVKVDLPIFVSTGNSPGCLFLRMFLGSEVAPKGPTFERSSPASPTRESNTPGLFGTAFPLTGTIRFFSDAQCTTLVGTGSSSDFKNVGVPVSLVQNTTSTIYSRVEDALGAQSPCTFQFDYIHTDGSIANPSFVAITPSSPNSQSLTPFVQGMASNDTDQVSLFADAACSVILASGTPADFAATGIQITVAQNFSTTVYVKAIDDSNNPSNCTYLTTYVHDSIAPNDPLFASESPTTPSNGSLSPLIQGTSTADSSSVKLFSNSLCLTQIGQGTKFSFESSGVNASVASNSVTQVYAQNIDAAGNSSNCTFMLEYIHNTFAPGAPIFGATIPSSPSNSSTTPLITGTPAPRTEMLNFYNDENCTLSMGSGTGGDFQAPGISLAASANTNNSIYVNTTDIEGNISTCFFLASYNHSNIPAQDPSFLFSFPASPNNSSSTPFIVGTADSEIATVRIYDDNSCTTLLGSGTRGQYSSSGVAISVPANSTTAVHAKAEDIYGNFSNCTSLLSYVHNTVIPDSPGFTGVTPLTPNNSSTSPFIVGTATFNPSSQLLPNKVEFYDSAICVGKLGEGPPSDFTAAGVQINVPANATSTIYSKTFDAAGNKSPCTFLLNYTHDSLVPGHPVFLSASPGSPSFSPDSYIKGNFSASTDFLLKTSLSFYTDSNCSSVLGSGTPSAYETTGIQINLPLNTITSLYAASVNEVGTQSLCQLQLLFNHHDLAPTGLNLNTNLDGSLRINWTPDAVPFPTPNYSIERSLAAQGPFTLLAANLFSSTYNDKVVSDQVTYFYRVHGENSTGRSQSSLAVSATVSAPATVQSSSLNAFPGHEEVTLTWGGFPQNMVYRVYRSNQPGGPYAPVSAVLEVLTYIDTAVTNNQSYYYIVTAINPSGESIQSNMASVTPRPLPSAPSQFTMRVLDSHPGCSGAAGVQLNWTAPSYFENFEVNSVRPGGGMSTVCTTGLSSCVVCGLADGIHTYDVSAVWGSKVSGSTPTLAYFKTTSPILTAAPGDSEIKLSWTQPDGGTLFGPNTPFFDVYRAPQKAGPYALLVPDHTGLVYTDTTVVQATPYFYYVKMHTTRVVTAQYTLIGPESAVQSAQASSAPAAPTNLILNQGSTSSTLNWSAPSHFNDFSLYQASNMGGPFSYAGSFTTTTIVEPPAAEGMNYFYITATWGNSETAATNTVALRTATLFGFSVTPSATQIDLAWSAVAGIQNYIVLRSLSEKGTYSTVGTPATETYSDLSALANIGYWYKVQAAFSDGTSGYTSLPKLTMRTGSNVPSGISIEVTSALSFTATWTPIVGATNYNVLVATNSGGPYTIKATSLSNASPVSGLIPNTQYFVKVRANIGVVDYDSDYVTMVTNLKPAAPFAEVGNNDINVLWSPTTGAIDYNLLRSTDNTSFAAIASNYGSTTYLDATAINGTIYFYKIQANYPVGSLLSDASSGYTPGVYPNAPTALIAENNNSATQALLSFAKVAGVTQYNIYQSNSPTGPWTTPLLTTSITDNVLITSLTAGNNYYFVSQSKNGQLTSAVSNVAALKIGLNLAAPTAKLDNGGGVLIEWLLIPSAASYNVERSTDGQAYELLTTGELGLSYIDSTTVANNTYYYRYQAVDGSGITMPKSFDSTPIAISIVPQPINSLSLSSTDGTSVDLQWILVPTAATYEILRGATAGGPYSSIQTVGATTTFFNDSSTSGGQTYFYVMKSINSYGVNSPDSNERGISLNGPPLNPIVNSSAAGLDLSWDSLAGSTQYNVLRSQVTGGPYGIVTSLAALNYTDSTTTPGKTYYYRIEGVYADTSISPRSVEVNALRSGYLDLQVPIEMIDQALGASQTQAITFERSQTSLNTTDYDGTVSYQLEITAINYDLAVHQVHLIDALDNTIFSQNIAGSTSLGTRIISTITPNAGSDIYRLRLDQSDTNLSLKILAARIVVTQTDATKTKLYFPLFAMDPIVSLADLTQSIYTTSSESYSTISLAMPYQLEATQLASLKEFNSWELETLTSVSGSAEGKFVLYNKTSALEVFASATRFADTSVQLGRIPIDKFAENFTPANENDIYDLRVRCEYNCLAGDVSLHKAGLWVQLENLTQAYVIMRNASNQYPLSISLDFEADRTWIDTSLFSNPQIFFQTELTDFVDSSADVSLVAHSLDVGDVGLSLVTGSVLSFDSDGRQTQRSGPLTVTSGDRFVTRFAPAGNNVQLHHSAIIIRSSGP